MERKKSYRMEKLKERLKEKGWTKQEIDKTIRIVKEAKEKKHPAIKLLDKTVYWIALLTAIIGNIIISISLIPSLMTLKSFPLFLVIIVLGISFGMLFELLIRSIEHLEMKHHIFLSIIIPIIAIINVFIITTVSNDLEKFFNINNPQNPILVGIVYAVAFIFPFLFYKICLKKDYYSD